MKSDQSLTASDLAPQAFEFVVGNRPGQLRANTTRRIKAHLSRQGWKPHLKPRTRTQTRQRRNKAAHVITYELASSNDCNDERDTVACALTNRLPLEYQLGGGRVDPFRSYPGEWKPFIPALVDHYLVHMAVDIPELDEPGNKGLLRTKWFPLVLSDIAAFQTVLLLSASNSASVNHMPDVRCELLQMKLEAIRSINSAFSDQGKRFSDAVIGAVAKMASFEAMHGNGASYHVHMQGLYQMVMARGGLDALGLGGLLRRIVVWIDLNSSFLLNIQRYFAGEFFDSRGETQEPNLERFVAP